jgi:hypothetical protein
VGLGRSEELDRTVGGLGMLEGPDLQGSGGDLCLGSARTDSYGLETVPVEVTSAEGTRRERESGQITSTMAFVNSELQRMVQSAPECGPGAIRGVRSLVNWPERSWVAGRTGFGPLDTGEDVGQTDMVGIDVTEAAPSALGISVQNDTDPIIESADKVSPAGVDKVIQTCFVDNSDDLEVYRRRDALPKGKSKVMQSENGSFKKGDMEENSLQSGAYDQGVGQSNDESSLVENTLKKSMEVSNVVGLSCEG